jgi:hypothetical protein
MKAKYLHAKFAVVCFLTSAFIAQGPAWGGMGEKQWNPQDEPGQDADDGNGQEERKSRSPRRGGQEERKSQSPRRGGHPQHQPRFGQAQPQPGFGQAQERIYDEREIQIKINDLLASKDISQKRINDPKRTEQQKNQDYEELNRTKKEITFLRAQREKNQNSLKSSSKELKSQSPRRGGQAQERVYPAWEIKNKLNDAIVSKEILEKRLKDPNRQAQRQEDEAELKRALEDIAFWEAQQKKNQNR